MRTARLLTVGGGVCLAEMFVWGGLCPGGYAHTPRPRGTPPPPWTDRHDTCENITLPQTSFAGDEYWYSHIIKAQ